MNQVRRATAEVPDIEFHGLRLRISRDSRTAVVVPPESPAVDSVWQSAADGRISREFRKKSSACQRLP